MKCIYSMMTFLWRISFKFKITDNKNTALKEHDDIIKDSSQLIIYMNESIIKDKVKVIIIVLNLKVKRNLLVEENNTVMIYAIELHELVLTLSIAEQYI